jgi:hypothetical protein
MPTKRTRRSRHAVVHRITPEAVQAWQAGDYWALHDALGLRLWQMPDWGHDPPDEPGRNHPLPHLPPAPDPIVLQAQLIAVAGPPPRRWVFKRPAAKVMRSHAD